MNNRQADDTLCISELDLSTVGNKYGEVKMDKNGSCIHYTGMVMYETFLDELKKTHKNVAVKLQGDYNKKQQGLS